jgi:hypothetical protein
MLDQTLFVMQEILLLFLTGISEVIVFLPYLPSENNSGLFVCHLAPAPNFQLCSVGATYWVSECLLVSAIY